MCIILRPLATPGRFLIFAIMPWLAVGTLDAQTPPTSRLERVVLVFKTHFDIGYTDLASNVLDRYRTTMIDQALEVCDRNRDLPPSQQFAWTVPGWPMALIAADWPGQTPERKQRIQQALKEGRFVVHGLPFTTHTELLEPEDLVRGLGFASQVSRSASIALPRDAKMTDVPCHSWILPTLLRHAGIEFLHLGCNAASRSPEVPLLFWWEGPDGSRLLTMYVAEGYGTGLLPPDNWPHRTWLGLIHTGDNHGPPKPDEIATLVAQLQAARPGVQVQIGRLADFADALLAENPQLPVVRGDMPDTWIHGPMCDPHGAHVARTVRPQIGATESLNTLLRLWGVRIKDATPTIQAAYEKSLLYGEHTWGGALYWVSSYTGTKALVYGDEWKKLRADGHFQRLESSWAEHTAYIEAAQDLIEPALNTQLNSLAAAVAAEGRRVVVFNPLPWVRSGLVSATWKDPAPAGLKALDSDEFIPVRRHAETIQFVARDLPPLGYRTFVPADHVESAVTVTCDAANNLMESPAVRLRLDPQRGTILSLVDQQTGREWVDASAPQAFGQYLYERFDRDQVAQFVKDYVKIDTDWALHELGKPNLPPAVEVPYRAIVPERFEIRYEQTPISASAIMESSPDQQLSHGVTTRITLYRDLPCVDIELTLRDKPADPWPEAGWICLPVRADSARFALGRLGSLVDPTRDLVPGSNHHLLTLNTGLAVMDANGSALGICPLDSPLISLGTPGCWQYSATVDSYKPPVYVNLFNNQWTTNFRLWNEGTWTSRVRLWPIGADNAAVSMTTTALEARYALQGAVARGPAGKLPTEGVGPHVSRKGVLATALGKNPDGPGTILRLWDLTGQPDPCELTLPDALSAQHIQYADLRGQWLKDAEPASGGKITVDVTPFAPTNLLFFDNTGR